MKRMAVIHSLEDRYERYERYERNDVINMIIETAPDIYREVEIIQQIDNNHVIAEYNGKHYRALDNPCFGYIYVDDLYGEVDKTFRY